MSELDLSEAVSPAGPIRDDGLVPLVIIRPGMGRGRGRHIYPAEMLREAVDAGLFKGWKMYVDHQAPEAKKAAGGLPRSMRDLGGILKEAWWDPAYPADERHPEPGAVMGLAKPTRFVRSLVEDVPEAVGASISAQATAIRPGVYRGESGNLVEGIKPKGSVDWVTEAGAGGKVVSLIEALEEGDVEEDFRDALGDLSGMELLEQLRQDPDLARHLLEEVEDEGDLTPPIESHEGGDEVPTAHEILDEALASDEGKQILREAVGQAFSEVVAPKLAELVEAALEDERELMQAEVGASSDRKLKLRDLREYAHATIDEAKLPDSFKAVLREQYDLGEGGPTPKLDVIDEVEDGKVVKTAKQVLAEALEADIETQRGLVASVLPTTVRGQGATQKTKVETPAGEGGEGGKVEEAKLSETLPTTARLLEEARLDPDEDVWADLK